jgi:anthranilate phosphoribosyltransferase
MIRDAIATVVSGVSLGAPQASTVMEEIMDGEATPAQVAAFVVGLRMKGETPDEIAGLAMAMRAKGVRIDPGAELDTCGTGGDGSHSFNISTAAAFVAAAAGVRVAKHGNRAMSSRCGSADVLESLGVRLDMQPGDIERCISDVGIGFLFAPMFHPAMKHAAGPRREIGVRTVFNILGRCAIRRRASATARRSEPRWLGRWLECCSGWGAGGRWWFMARTDWMRSRSPGRRWYANTRWPAAALLADAP